MSSISKKAPEGWRSTLLSEICRLQNGHGFKPHEWTTTGLPIIRIQNLNGNTNFNYYAGTAEEDWLVPTGQLLFAWAGTKGVSFGPTIWRGPTAVLNQHIFKVFAHHDIDTQWLLYCLRYVTQRIESKAHGFKSTLVHVRKSDIEKQQVLLPPHYEQVRIARILATWDRAIEATEKLLANSEAQRTGLLQNLLTGRRRLTGFPVSEVVRHNKIGRVPKGWGIFSIGDIASEVSDRNDGKHNYPVLSCSKHAGFVRSLDYFKKQIFSTDTSNYKMVRRNQFGFPSNHVEEGSIGLQTLVDCGIVSPIYCVFEASDAVRPQFLLRLLKTDRYRQLFAAATNASVDRRGSLRWREFSQLPVAIPPHQEQDAINDAVDVLECHASKLSLDLSNLKVQRSMLLQDMMTGKRRASNEQEAA